MVLRSGLFLVLSVALLWSASGIATTLADPAKPANAADPMPPEKAKAILDDAKARLKDRKANYNDIEAALIELSKAHAASRDAKYRRAAEKQLLRAFLLTKKDRRTGGNLRANVNAFAGELLAKTAKVLDRKEAKALSAKVRAGIKDVRKRWDEEWWNADHIEAGFAALAALNDHAVLMGLSDEYVHTKSREVVFVVGALKALPSFQGVPGKTRRYVCDRLRKTYIGMELVADRLNNSASDAAVKRVWDQLRTYVIPAMQHYAGRPVNEKGEALSSMREFRVWWNDHKSLRDPAWQDTK